MPYPHRTRPMTALLVFTGLNVVLVSTISLVYDFVCFLPYWERRVCFSFLSFLLLSTVLIYAIAIALGVGTSSF
ncbi:hypothetical protein PTKIN_Ptkin08bG0092800 [Pterospermum kingtungense]